MPDSFTEVSEMGLFGRIKRSLKGILAGIAMILISFPVLWLNEGNSAKSHAGLSQLAKETLSVSAETVDPANDGKPVYLSGKTTTDDTLTDSRFAVSANAIKLIRSVEMYQWRESSSSETEKQLGGGEKTITTYNYSKEWSERPIDSSRFKDPVGHENPPMPYKSKTFLAKNVPLGAFKLSEDLIRQVSGRETLNLTAEQRAALPENMRNILKDDGPGYYQGANPATPAVGDIRIRFGITNPAIVSIIARQRGDTFESFVAKSGKSFSILKMNSLSPENVIASERSQLKVMTWVFRFVGWLLMFLGFASLFKPLSVVADIVPFFGDIVGAGTGFIAAIIAAALSLTTIAIAWIAYRPLVGVPLLAISLGLTVFAFMKINSAKKDRLATA